MKEILYNTRNSYNMLKSLEYVSPQEIILTLNVSDAREISEIRMEPYWYGKDGGKTPFQKLREVLDDKAFNFGIKAVTISEEHGIVLLDSKLNRVFIKQGETAFFIPEGDVNNA